MAYPMMNVYAAWVNVSGYTIPVYSRCDIVRPGGSYGAGGEQIGTLYPSEFYCTAPRDTSAQNVDYAKIYFRNRYGNMQLGYIEPQPNGIATGYEPWYSGQSHYVNKNSNGSSLVDSVGKEIDGINYRIFTVKKKVEVRYPSGTLYGYLDVGTQLATYESTAGVNYHGHMVFHKYKSPNSNTWYSLCGNYGFVDLGLSIGSEPSSRPIW